MARVVTDPVTTTRAQALAALGRLVSDPLYTSTRTLALRRERIVSASSALPKQPEAGWEHGWRPERRHTPLMGCMNCKHTVIVSNNRGPSPTVDALSKMNGLKSVLFWGCRDSGGVLSGAVKRLRARGIVLETEHEIA